MSSTAVQDAVQGGQFTADPVLRGIDAHVSRNADLAATIAQFKGQVQDLAMFFEDAGRADLVGPIVDIGTVLSPVHVHGAVRQSKPVSRNHILIPTGRSRREGTI